MKGRDEFVRAFFLRFTNGFLYSFDSELFALERRSLQSDLHPRNRRIKARVPLRAALLAYIPARKLPLRYESGDAHFLPELLEKHSIQRTH